MQKEMNFEATALRFFEIDKEYISTMHIYMYSQSN